MKASAIILTYNQQDYISTAIESVLRQECNNFSLQIIIGEDCSTDNTRHICEDFAKQYPEKITLLPATKNMGMLKNFVRCFEACDGDYIAFVEGDDYWNDPFKLIKQVNFLSQHNDYSACFHNAIIKNQRNGENVEWLMHRDKLEKDCFETEDIFKPWFIPSGSVMFVKYTDWKFPDWFFNCRSGDIPMLLLLSLRGKLKYIDEPMCVYRLHNSGVSATHVAYKKITLMIYIFESFNIFTNYKFQEAVTDAVIYEIQEHLPKSTPVVEQQSLRKARSIKSIFTRK